MSTGYPEEKHKARWRAILWLFNIAGCSIGASVALGISWKTPTDGVPSTVYITFIALQVGSALFAAFVLSPDKLRRTDGTALARFDHISFMDTLKITGRLFKDRRVILLIPVMFTPEMSFPFQSTMNAYVFNLRARTLNSLLNSLVQIPTTFFAAWLLDNEKLGTRKKCLIMAITFVAVWMTGNYIAPTAWLAAWDFDLSVRGPAIDCTDAAYAGAVTIYLLYAAQYGAFQGLVLYALSTFTNEPCKIAAPGGLYVGGECPRPLKHQTHARMNTEY